MQPKWPLTDEWINKIHAMEHYSGLEREENLIHAVTWMNSEDILLVKQASHKRTNNVGFYLSQVSEQ